MFGSKTQMTISRRTLIIESDSDSRHRCTSPYFIIMLFGLTAKIYRLIDCIRCGIGRGKKKTLQLHPRTKTLFFCERLPSDYVIHVEVIILSLKKSWLWRAWVVVAQTPDEASSLPCSLTWICQPVALRTQAQTAFWDSLCLTLSLLDNIQILYKIEMRFTRLTRKRSCAPLSYFQEATCLCTYFLEVLWPMQKWLTYQSNLATASK